MTLAEDVETGFYRRNLMEGLIIITLFILWGGFLYLHFTGWGLLP